MKKSGQPAAFSCTVLYFVVCDLLVYLFFVVILFCMLFTALYRGFDVCVCVVLFWYFVVLFCILFCTYLYVFCNYYAVLYVFMFVCCSK